MAFLSSRVPYEGRGTRTGGTQAFPFAAALGGGRVHGTRRPSLARGGEPVVGAGAAGPTVHAVGGGGEYAVGAGGDVGGRFSMQTLAGGFALERFEYPAETSTRSPSRRVDASAFILAKNRASAAAAFASAAMRRSTSMSTSRVLTGCVGCGVAAGTGVEHPLLGVGGLAGSAPASKRPSLSRS